MDSNNFYKVPKDYIYEMDEYELMTYISILDFRTLSDSNKAYLSAKMICDKANYSSTDRRKESYYSLVRKHIHLFLGRNWIKISNPIITNKINPSECIEVILTDLYIPKEKFIKLSQTEFDTIVNNDKYKNKASLLHVFLYIKSFMYADDKDRNRSISAYYVSGMVASHTLGMSRSKYDACVNTLCELGLLICRQTGSYYDETGIKNAPNIYVLNDDRAEDNIRGAMSRLRYKLLNPQYGNKDDFMPIVYIGKTIKKDKTESEFEDHIQDDEEDNGEWGDRNPMERNYYNYY